MYEYCINVDGNNSITYVFMRDTYFPVQELEELCKKFLIRYGVEEGFSMLESILIDLGFQLLVDKVNFINCISVRKEDISVNFNFKNV